MSENQSAKTTAKRLPSPGQFAIFGAIATALAVFNMSGESEAQPLTVVILEWTGLALGLIALAGGLIMMTARK
jgi:hypothetical protein